MPSPSVADVLRCDLRQWGMATTSSKERSIRHSKDEIRALMMTAGTELLEEEGLGIGAVDLTFKRVFDRVLATSGVRLTNGSVIRRVWENQAEFQDDVLAAIARERPIPVYFIGVGEQLNELETFNAREFAQALLS